MVYSVTDISECSRRIEVKDADKNTQQIITWNSEEFDGETMQIKSTCGMLTSAVDFAHRDAPFACVTTMYRAMMNLSKHDKER